MVQYATRRFHSHLTHRTLFIGFTVSLRAGIDGRMHEELATEQALRSLDSPLAT